MSQSILDLSKSAKEKKTPEVKKELKPLSITDLSGLTQKEEKNKVKTPDEPFQPPKKRLRKTLSNKSKSKCPEELDTEARSADRDLLEQLRDRVDRLTVSIDRLHGLLLEELQEDTSPEEE